jgi:ligand-binding sensor domain-containing protein
MNKSFHIAVLLIAVSAANAQRLPFKNYTTADGLPGSFVRDIVQDKYGYIWINTDGGVAQFDGVEFNNYTAANNLSYIFRDSSGYVYLAGLAGLWRMAGDERVFYHVRKNLGPVKKAIYAKDGTLWFCHGQAEMGSIKHAGLSRISKDQLEEYPDTMLDSLGACQLLKIFEDYRGNFWLRFWSQKLNKDVWRRFSNSAFSEATITSHALKDWYIRDIVVDRYGSIWLFAWKRVGEKLMQGTFKFAKAKWTEYSNNTGLLLSKGTLDDEGNLWLIARQYEHRHKGHRWLGVTKAVEDTLHWFTEKQGLVSNKVHYMAKGRNGALWFVTKNGASKYQNGKLQTIVADFGWSETSADKVVFEDSQGKFWFLWHNHAAKSQEAKIGIAVHADGQIKNYTSKHGIIGEHWVKKLLPLDTDEETFIWEDNRGHVWFQTDKALFHASNGELQRYDQKNGLAGPLLLSWEGSPFLQDREGNIWIGTEGGVSKLSDQSHKRYTKEDGLTSNFVWSPYQDKKGRIWVRADAQVNYMLEDRIEKLNLEDKEVGGFLEDKFGNMYFITGARASKFNGKKVQHFDLPHSAPVFQQDDSGNIWFGECCGNGVSKYDGKKIQHYTAKEGFVNRSAQSIFQDLRGHIWFVGTSGISKFDGNQFSNHNTAISLFELSSEIYSIDQRKHVWLRDKEILHDLTDPAEPARQLPAMVRQGVTVMRGFWDRDGNNWLGTANGLVKIGKRDLQIFTVQDGLPGNKLRG